MSALVIISFFFSPQITQNTTDKYNFTIGEFCGFIFMKSKAKDYICKQCTFCLLKSAANVQQFRLLRIDVKPFDCLLPQ